MEFFKENPGAHQVTEEYFEKKSKYKSSVVENFFPSLQSFLSSLSDGKGLDKLKSAILKNFKEVAERYFKEYPENDRVSRGYWRKNRDKSLCSDDDVDSLFGSFKGLSKSFISDIALTFRKDLDDLIGRNTKYPAKFVISAVVAGAVIEYRFYDALKKYCEVENATLILLPMRGVSRRDGFSKEVFDLIKDYLKSEFYFNETSRVVDFGNEPQKRLPLTGLKEQTQDKSGSMFIAAPKQHAKMVCAGKNEYAHMLSSTGTISIPQ